MRMKKKGVLLFCTFCIFFATLLLPLSTFAISINTDVYRGALSISEFREKYDPENKNEVSVRWNGSEDENGVKHATNFILSAPPYEGAPKTEIDRISLDYSPQLILPKQEINLDVPNPLDPEDPSYINGSVKTSSEVHYEQFETWEEYEQESLSNGFVKTTFEGLPALEKWHDDREYENKIPLSARRVIRVLLLDDSHIPGMVVLRIETLYFLGSSWMMGEDAERFMAPIWKKNKEVWEKDLREIGEKMLSEVSDQTEVTLTRVRLYPGKLGEVPKEVKEKEKQQEKKRANVEVDSQADKEKGETDVSIPAALAIVIIGGAAAMAGAGSGSGGGDSGDGDQKKKSRYKMCLNKDFGDAIRYNAPPVTVYARIVEITPGGEEIDRPDLSAAIEMFSGEELKVESTAMAGNYKGALVYAESVPGTQNPESGVLSIRFSGEGGSFQNNVTFRLVGDAYIHFTERGKELTPTTYMLYGDNGDYEVPIELRDFIMPPQKVSLELPDNQPFTAEAEKVDDTHYVIRMHNKSQVQADKVQPQQIIMVTVYAQNDKESAHDSFIVNILPKGISLRPFTGCPIDENGRLHVACSLTPEQGEDETEIEQTHFQLVLAVSKTDDSGKTRAALVESSQVSYRFEQMTAQIEKLQNLLKAFPYKIDSSEASSAGIFRICPKRQLPQDDRLDYDVVLPVTCDYENQTYALDIPIRLLGDKLLPMAEKSEEIRLLIKRIRKFVDEEKRAELIWEFKNDLPKMSATDVRLLSKSLVYATQSEVYKANMHLLDAEMLDWVLWGLEWYKWIGDQAISVIISKLSYNYAPFVEAVVMPAKDLLVEHMGIWLSDYVSGAQSPGAVLDIEKLESTGLTMIENMLTNLIDGKTNPKKAVGILSIYLVIRTANYYFYEKNEDGSSVGIYGAITSAFGDLTAQSFKIILGTKLEQLAKNPATTKIFGGYADEFIKGLFPAEFYNSGGKWEFDLIKKYIEEITVLASAKIYSGVLEGAEQDTSTNKFVVTLIENTENPEKTVRISVTPMDLGKDFFDYIFDKLFGMLQFVDSVVESPKDPPCMLA